MVEKKKVKKVQISITEEQYKEIESTWLALGFSSVSEAARFLLMNKVDEFYRQIKKSQKAVTKLQELKQGVKMLTDSEAAPVQIRKIQEINTPSLETTPTSGNIEKGSPEYAKIISLWQSKNPNFIEPQSVKGLRWWIDETSSKKKIAWWK